jgi:hypothetical protein
MRAQLADAMPELDARFDDFEQALLAEGWCLAQLLPSEAASARLLDDAGDTTPRRELAAATADQTRREA